MRAGRIFTLLLVVAVAGINLWRTGIDSLRWDNLPATAARAGASTSDYLSAMMAAFAIASAWLPGALLTGLLWPRRGEAALVLSIGAGLGLGLTALIFHLASQVSAHPLFVAFPAELLLGCILLFMWLRKMRTIPPCPVASKPARSWLGSLVRLVFAAGCAIALHSLVVTWRSVPAELCGGGAPGEFPLVAAGMARSVAYIGGTTTPFAAGLGSMAFSIATLTLLVAGVARLRNRLIALTGGLVLLGTPFFSRFTPVEHADVPFGFFLLTALALITIARDENDHGMLFLAGLAAGLAAWTKPEGLVFCLALGFTFGVAQCLAGHRRNLPPLFGGLVLVLVPLAWIIFKSSQIPGFMSGQGTDALARLADWSRYLVILRTWWRDLPHFGEWYLLPFFVMALHLVGPWRDWSERRTVTAATLLLLMLAGCHATYLLGSADLAEQLDVSLARLLMQVWPAAIFLWCLLAVRTAPAQAAGQTSPVGSPADSAPSGQSA